MCSKLKGNLNNFKHVCLAVLFFSFYMTGRIPEVCKSAGSGFATGGGGTFRQLGICIQIAAFSKTTSCYTSTLQEEEEHSDSWGFAYK